VANVAVGFDLLGFAIAGVGDTVSVQKRPLQDSKAPVQISKIHGIRTELPMDPEKNTATLGLLQLIKDFKLPFGFDVQIEKGIPMGSGMGGSAASAVAAAVAANSLLPEPLPFENLLSYILLGEAAASGGFHADNIAPCLLGGLTLAKVAPGANAQQPQVQVTELPVPQGLFSVLVHPHLQIETKTARGLLKKEISLKSHTEQSSLLAEFVVACFQNDRLKLKNSMRDILIEPQRSHLIPGFLELQSAALRAGALTCSISGSGPSVFAWAPTLQIAQQVQSEIQKSFAKHKLESEAWCGPLLAPGARLIL
jgi:homoserine kinase